MTHKLDPKPAGTRRARQARKVRREAAELGALAAAPSVPPANNGEVERYQPESPTAFTKGLLHDDYGIVVPGALPAFVRWLNQRRRRPQEFEMPDPVGTGVTRATDADLKTPNDPTGATYAMRRWESPLSGHGFDLEGDDPGATGLPPAPRLFTGELAAEMGEVYALALLRDVPFAQLAAPSPALQALEQIPWFQNPDPDPAAERRRQARLDGAEIAWFRGSTPGSKVGPYLSQFLVAGSPGMQDQGFVGYGRTRIDLRSRPHAAGRDYMQPWNDWLDVQQGARRNGEEDEAADYRFLATPRDLATYVHFDALYQAYLTAALFLLSWDLEVDRGLPEGPIAAGTSDTRTHRAGFATFGGPHVLSLVTEVATRALKAVRRQKYQVHLRARPEVLAARLCLIDDGAGGQLGGSQGDFQRLFDRLDAAVGGGGSLLQQIHDHNVAAGHPLGAPWATAAARNLLLPMAFAEGSPMHPAYGAGHATVAGACVTVLKAFFEMYEEPSDDVNEQWVQRSFTSLYERREPDNQLLEPEDDGSAVKPWTGDGVTILGELDKLAANISIGRNMAGVHYYTDYYESLRLGERVAVSILREQMLTYPEPLSMRLTTFDGVQMRIVGRGDGEDVDLETDRAWP